jgi:hypothetical protein
MATTASGGVVLPAMASAIVTSVVCGRAVCWASPSAFPKPAPGVQLRRLAPLFLGFARLGIGGCVEGCGAGCVGV